MFRPRILYRCTPLLVGMLFLTSLSDARGQAPKRNGDSKDARRQVEFKTTADMLTKEVIADEKAAQVKYKGKIVEVEGQVEFANKIINANGFSIKGAKKKPTDATGMSVICNVPKAALGKAWRLSSGQKVKVVGTVTVSAFAVFFTDCTVEPLEPAMIATVTAKGLAAEVAKDASTAKKKYQTSEGYPKEIIVAGEVSALEKDKNGFHTAKLAGTDGITVNCTVNQEDFAALKIGDTVTIKGDFSNYYPDEKGVVVNTAFILPKE
jgi:hypothetical protein